MLHQTIDDALGVTRAAHQRNEGEQVVAAARLWVRRGGEDFALVCWLAGYDPAVVRPRVLARLRALETPTAARAAAE